MGHSKITQIQMRGWKSFGTLDWKCGDVNVLVGANGAGKTCLITLFAFVCEIINERLQAYVSQNGHADSLLHGGTRKTRQMEFSVRFASEKGDNTYWATLATGSRQSLLFLDEGYSFNNRSTDTPPSTHLGSGHAESRLRDRIHRNPQDATAKFFLSSMLRWVFFQMGDTSRASPMRQPARIKDSRYLARDCNNLSAMLYAMFLSNQDLYLEIEGLVRQVCPQFESFIWEPDDGWISMKWTEKGASRQFDGSHMSDGLLRFLAIAVALMQPQVPAAVIMDDPDRQLNPVALRIVADLVRRASQRCQVFLTTQSPTLREEFDPENIMTVERCEEGSRIVPFLASETSDATSPALPLSAWAPNSCAVVQ